MEREQLQTEKGCKRKKDEKMADLDNKVMSGRDQIVGQGETKFEL